MLIKMPKQSKKPVRIQKRKKKPAIDEMREASRRAVAESVKSAREQILDQGRPNQGMPETDEDQMTSAELELITANDDADQYIQKDGSEKDESESDDNPTDAEQEDEANEQDEHLDEDMFDEETISKNLSKRESLIDVAMLFKSNNIRKRLIKAANAPEKISGITERMEKLKSETLSTGLRLDVTDLSTSCTILSIYRFNAERMKWIYSSRNRGAIKNVTRGGKILISKESIDARITRTSFVVTAAGILGDASVSYEDDKLVHPEELDLVNTWFDGLVEDKVSAGFFITMTYLTVLCAFKNGNLTREAIKRRIKVFKQAADGEGMKFQVMDEAEADQKIDSYFKFIQTYRHAVNKSNVLFFLINEGERLNPVQTLIKSNLMTFISRTSSAIGDQMLRYSFAPYNNAIKIEAIVASCIEIITFHKKWEKRLSGQKEDILKYAGQIFPQYAEMFSRKRHPMLHEACAIMIDEENNSSTGKFNYDSALDKANLKSLRKLVTDEIRVDTEDDFSMRLTEYSRVAMGVVGVQFIDEEDEDEDEAPRKRRKDR